LSEKRHDILQQKQEVTARVSETTRYVGFGLLAVYYALRTANDGYAQTLAQEHPVLVGLVGLSGLVAIILDYLQYFFGSRSVNDALQRESLDYNTASVSYRGRAITFALKQWAAVFGAALLAFMFAVY
jgi:hypothetical protein